MKQYIFAALLMSTSLTARADMKPEGTFLPNLCSSGSNEVQVCYGTKSGIANAEFLSVGVARVLPTVYQITNERPVNGGINPEYGASVLTLVSATGETITANVHYYKGLVTSMTVINSDGSKFIVSKFVKVFITQ